MSTTTILAALAATFMAIGIAATAVTVFFVGWFAVWLIRHTRDRR
jgi:uncharacterized membrane protein